MKLLVLDNYDSFTYNLVHILRESKLSDLAVYRNDKITLEEVGRYDKILLSPGPGVPSEAGIMPELVKEYASTKSILGVCLGHQCIGEQFGAKLHNMEHVVHGKPSMVTMTKEEEPIFRNIPNTFEAGRYHSWVVSQEGLPECLKVTARSEDGNIMALRHSSYDVSGVQFHPESVLTEVGSTIINNWIAC